MGQGISLIGTWLQGAAVRWLVFEQTGSELSLGIVEASSLAPGFVVGLIAGVLADHLVPRTMILLMELAQMSLAFLLATLVGLGVVEVWQMALILALGRVCVAFEMPSRQVFFFELVGPTILPNAIALNSGLFNATRVVGPALAGIFLSILGPTVCFTLNGLSFVAALLAILSIRLPRREHHPRAGGGLSIREVLGGLSYVRRERRILDHFLLMAGFGIVAMGYEAMIPAFARRVVHMGVSGYGLLLASAGLGATAGALMVASLGGVWRRERMLLAGMLVFAGSLGAGSSFASWAPGDESSFRSLAASLCLLGAGFGAVLFYASTQTVIQLAVPDKLRGRIMGIWMIVYSGSVPLGALWTGRVAQVHGVPFVMGISALICALIAVGVGISGRLVPESEKGSSSEIELAS
jgi:MFS family permease